MKIFIGAITFVISVIVVKIVFIVIASPALFIPSISDSSNFHGIIMFTAVIASVCSGVFCFKKKHIDI